MHFLWLPLLPLLCAALRGGFAVRVNDDEEYEEDQQATWNPDLGIETSCKRAIADLYDRTTYRQLFSPVMPGKYQLRQTNNGLFMSSDGTRLTATRDDGDSTHFVLGQVARDHKSFGMLNYTLRHASSGAFLAGDDSRVVLSPDAVNSPEGYWSLTLGSNGSEWAVVNKASGKSLSISILTQVIVLDEITWEERPGKGGGFWSGQQWQLVPLEASERTWRKKRSDHLKEQWEVVRKLPVMPGRSRMTWDKICPDGEVCHEWYEVERDRQNASSKIYETQNDRVIQNKIRGLCDWTVPGLRGWIHNVDVVTEISQVVNESSCPTNPTDFEQALAMTLEDYCFGSCEFTLSSHVFGGVNAANGDPLLGMSCVNAQDQDWDKFFNDAIADNPECVSLNADALRNVADHQMQKKCLTFYPPSQFWVPRDEARGQVCIIQHFDAHSQDPSDIIQVGTCPEGSRCDCPRLYENNQDTIAEQRKETFDTFVPDAAAIVPVFVAQFQADMLVEVGAVAAELLIIGGVSGLTLGVSTLTATYSSISWITAVFIGGFQGIRDSKDGFRCADTVGCWTVKPKVRRTVHSKGACRMPEEARSGRSPYWFMPPPMLVMRRSWFSCAIKACTAADLNNQKVGFGREHNTRSSMGRPNVYNCEPLTFTEMNDVQKEAYAQRLACTGVFEEYTPPEGVSAACGDTTLAPPFNR